MDQKVVVDCSTGQSSTVNLTPAESSQIAADRTAAIEAAKLPPPPTLDTRLTTIEQAITNASDFGSMKASLKKPVK